MADDSMDPNDPRLHGGGIAPSDPGTAYVDPSKSKINKGGLGDLSRKIGADANASPATSMPRQNPGEDSVSYGARIRQWRNEQDATPDNIAQKKALSGMQK